MRYTGLSAIGLILLLQSGLAFGQGMGGMGGMGGAAAAPAEVPDSLKPTYANLAYGPHELNVLDFWQAEASSPTPLVVYYHPGAFRAGTKDALVTGNGDVLQELLDAGISVAAVDYRLMGDAPLPAAYTDSMRALQFLRSKSEEWNVDASRVGAWGGSAGAAISMWMAFHEEMGNPEAPDPIARESTRLIAVATDAGQTMIDPAWWAEWIPGDNQNDVFSSLRFESEDEAERLSVARSVSALTHVSADDPPIHMTYNMAPEDPVPAQGAAGWQIHHVVFGVKLKEKADELGLESYLGYPGRDTPYFSVVEFFDEKLKGR